MGDTVARPAAQLASVPLPAVTSEDHFLYQRCPPPSGMSSTTREVLQHHPPTQCALSDSCHSPWGCCHHGRCENLGNSSLWQSFREVPNYDCHFPFLDFYKLLAKCLKDMWCWTHGPHLLWICRMPAARQKARALWWLMGTLFTSSIQLIAPGWVHWGWGELLETGSVVKRRVKRWTELALVHREQKVWKRQIQRTKGCKIWAPFCCEGRRCNEQQSGQPGLPPKCIWTYLPGWGQW